LARSINEALRKVIGKRSGTASSARGAAISV
jgi:hypothetical protein